MTSLQTPFIELADNLWGHVFDPNKRLFWGYLLATFGFATFVWWRSKCQKSLIQFLFPRAVWLNQSAKQDYIVWLLNAAIKTILIIPLLFSAAPIAIELSFFLERTFGDRPPLFLDKTAVALSFTLMLFVLDDLTRYWLHLLLHKVPALWAIHKVHHSAEVMTPITVYRIHPIESALYACRLVLSQGLVLGLGFYLFGHRLDVVDVLGANIGVFLFNMFAANLRHSHVWLTWPKVLEKWLISPAQHQIHHSSAIEHRDKNIGSALAIWDRIAGSLVLSEEANRKLTFGVGHRPYKNLIALYALPCIEFCKAIIPKRRHKKALK